MVSLLLAGGLTGHVASAATPATVLSGVAGALGAGFTGGFGTVGRIGLDVLAMFLLVGWLYRRRVAAPEMALVFTALNVGLLAAVLTIGSGDFPTGIGFGLFGLLSLVRLRSAAFTLKDVAYTFIALVLALVNGLPERNLALVVALNVVLLGAVWLVDDSRSSAPTQVMRMVLDRALTEPAQVRAAVARRLGSAPVSVAVEDVDFVRDTTRVIVRYTVADADAAPAWPDAPGSGIEEWTGDRSGAA
ncbi:MAG: DUF4956 domain-containing protein [Nocardioidaceae bacterium]